jgi:glycogen debranching enzyme
MSIHFGRDICGDVDAAQAREWLVTNGIGSYASGTVAGLVTRGYHGLLVAALKPPLERTVLLTKIDETACYDGTVYPLFTNRWANGVVDPSGYRHIESFHLEGTMPVWRFALGDALLEKRMWMQPGANTTYVYYSQYRGSQTLTLSLKALVNYRGYHSRTRAGDWRMRVAPIERGVCVTAFSGAVPFYLFMDSGHVSPAHEWYYGFALARERDRGLEDLDDNLHAATFEAVLLPESPLTSAQQRRVVEICGRFLLTSHGLRSLAPDDRQYQGHYGGDQWHRDRAYHEGTVWGWLLGPFVLAHQRVFNDPGQAREFLRPMAHHLSAAGLGSISEIFDGDAPMLPQGCIAQAWSVAEVLRAWLATET